MSWSRVFTQLSQLKLLSHVIKVLVLAMETPHSICDWSRKAYSLKSQTTQHFPFFFKLILKYTGYFHC